MNKKLIKIIIFLQILLKLQLTHICEQEIDMQNISKKLPPVIFISHGGPTTSFRDYEMGTKKSVDTYCDNVEQEGKRIIKLYGIEKVIIVSGHYETNKFSIVSDQNPKTIHDHGFSSIFKYQNNNSGDPELAQEIYQLLKQNNLPTELDKKWGFDHGVWSAIKLLDKEEKLKVVSVSQNQNMSAEQHVNFGKILSKFREQNVLIVGSGHSTHNLQMTFSSMRQQKAHPQFKILYDFEKELENNSLNQIGEEREKGAAQLVKSKNYKLSHPTDDHFFPYLVAAGAAGQSKGRKFVDVIDEQNGFATSCFIYE